MPATSRTDMVAAGPTRPVDRNTARCYCHSFAVPHVHVLADHDRKTRR